MSDGAAVSVRSPARPGRLLPALGVGGIWLFLLIFLVYPLMRILYDAFSDEAGRLTLANFVEFARDRYYIRALGNSRLLGLCTVAATSVLGFAVAFLLVRYDFAGRNLFSYLTLIPIISPPLVGVLGLTFIMGRAGTVNVLLEDWFGLARPVNFVYGLHGVLLVETLHLFPMITLNVVAALARIDPAPAPAPLAPGPGGSGGVPVGVDAAVVRPVSGRSARVRRPRVVADPVPGPLHVPLLRARHRRDAEVHREQLPLLRAGGGAVYRRG